MLAVKAVAEPVAEAKDVVVMEKLKNFNGSFHVLGGCINPLEHKT